MPEVIADVVTTKWQHRHRISPHLADRAGRGRRRFRSHGGTKINAMVPIERLIDQRHGIATPAAKDDRADRHARALAKVWIDDRIVRGRRGESAVRMRGFFLRGRRSEEHTSELQSRFGISYAVFCLKNKKKYDPVLHGVFVSRRPSAPLAMSLR